MSRNKVFRLSASRLDASNDLLAVCIPYWFRDVLLDVTERFLWSRVWRDGDESHQLTEEEIARIEYAIYRLTIDSECTNVCEHCDLIPVILERLEELSDMNINVNCGGGCGCGCGGQNQNEEVPEEGDIEVPPAPSDDEQESQDVGRCIAANYAATALENSLLSIYDYTGQYSQAGYLGWKSGWVTRWLPQPSAPTAPGYGNYLLARSYLLLTTGASLASQIPSRHNNLVCLLYNSSSMLEAEEAVAAWAGTFSGFFPSGFNLLARYVDWSILFVPGLSIPPGYGNSCCGSVPGEGSDVEPPDAPAGYAWLPVSSAHLSLLTSTGTGGLVPVETVSNGIMVHGFTGAGGWTTTWTINNTNILNDTRLPSVGLDVVGCGQFLQANNITSNSFWGWSGGTQTDWGFSIGVSNAPGNSWILKESGEAIGAEVGFTYDMLTAVLGTNWEVYQQGTNISTRLLLWWLVKL